MKFAILMIISLMAYSQNDYDYGPNKICLGGFLYWQIKEENHYMEGGNALGFMAVVYDEKTATPKRCKDKKENKWKL